MVGGSKSSVVIVGAVVVVVRSAVAVAGLVVVEWPAGRGSPCCAGGRFWCFFRTALSSLMEAPNDTLARFMQENRTWHLNN
jgi:hypothetical protein